MAQENQGKKSGIHTILVKVILIAGVALLISFSFGLWLGRDSSSAFRENLKDWIRKELVSVDSKTYPNVVDAVYVLGGPQNSLEFRFQTAADLYSMGICKKVLILSRPGITEYSSLLKKNLTNDEWAILTLEELGIPENKIEAISIKEGFFGTFAEAKGISKLARKRGYENMVLISTPYHTRRVKISFKNFLKDQDITFYVKGSDKRVFLRHLMIEFIKLKIYQYFLVS